MNSFEVWTLARAATTPLPVGGALIVLDLRGETVRAHAALGRAGLLIVGSAAAAGAWLAHAGGTPIAVVPPVIAAAGAAYGTFLSLHILADADTAGLARQAADWARRRGIGFGVAAGPLGLIGEIGAAPEVSAGAAVLDLRLGLDAPHPLLGIGAPTLFLADAPLRAALEDAGAALRIEAIEDGLAGFAALPCPARLAMSAATLGFVQQHFSAERAARAEARAVSSALAGRQARETAPLGVHVLVVSDEALNLIDIRVHLPFGAMVASGSIGGYSVLRFGEFVFSTFPVTPGLRFGAIWVQRSVDPQVQLLLRVLERPFVYDLDDNLLISPSYRPAFSAGSVATAAAMIGDCAVLSVATARLARGLGLADQTKVVVTPNLAGAAARVVEGRPSVVVWASSDVPALAGSRVEVERAVRDFCLAHGLRLMCIGAVVPAAFEGVAVERVGMLSYAAYRARLSEAAPGILVGPLETGGDGQTQAFVNGKSDVKVIEAAVAGLAGVFSRAAPYVDSDLKPSILCENTYEAWIAGLERALRERPDWVVPAARSASGTGLVAWAEALRGALRGARCDVTADEVAGAVRFMRAQGETLLATPALFDEADYLERHEDVRLAVADGVVASGYRHYVQSGFREGRLARRMPDRAGDAAFWWSRLLDEVGRLEAATRGRGREIEALADRVALQRLVRRADVPAAVAEDRLVRWENGDAVVGACPVCDAAGPHAGVLAIEGQALARCGACGTCFYADRTVHHYETDDAAATLLQLYLEQNAGIYHQTRALFAVEGGESLLDIGCSFGFAVDLARSVLGWRAVGVDPSFAAVAGAAQLGADIRTEYLTEETALGDNFRIVTASEMIEHLPEPYGFLGLVRRRLAPDGILVLTTPDAAAIGPQTEAADLTGILAVRVHLTLFTADSLGFALRRAGFKHVTVESAGNALVAYASDRPLRWRSDREARHVQAYRAYLEGLVERATPGSALWNGAAGRLLALLAPTAELAGLRTLLAAIAQAWRERFGIDLEAMDLPPIESEVARRALRAATLAARQPLNLAGVLLQRAVVEQRAEGARSEGVLAFARAAYLHAVQTGRVLQAENMIDLDLKQTAWRARMLIIDCLAALAPEVEGELVQALAARSAGALAEWIDPPAEAVARRAAAVFAREVGCDRFDAARRLERLVTDFDLLAAALADRPELLLRTLFTVGVQRLLGDGDADGALEAFERMAREARALLDRPGRQIMAQDFLRMAQQHMQLAADRIGGSE